jgi:subtilisin family serine protease
MHQRAPIHVFGLILALSLCRPAFAQSQVGGFKDKIEAKVLSDLKRDQAVNFFVVLNEQADVHPAAAIRDWKNRGEAVVNSLKETANRTQPTLLNFLARFNAQVRPFWIVNTIRVTTTDEQLIYRLAALPNVASIKAEQTWQVPDPTPAASEATIQSVEWGVARVHAPDVWTQFGARGQGIVVASIDTGVQFDHPAIVAQYRGRKADGSFDHNYNWYDPARVCGNPSLAPCDNNGHGTHTMGTMVGNDNGANQIGVAPGAQWITAKGCENSSCSSSSLLAAGQWMLAPTDLNGQNPRPDLRPNIVSNSWGSDTGTDTFYRVVVQAWVNAGIFPVFAIGNSGPSCGTADAPGTYPESFGIGATDITDNIASFSGRGPISGFGNVTKPNVSAPGVSIRSSVPTSSYATLSGTSMATPHAAGVAALLWSANPGLVGNIAATEDLLQRSADFRSNTQCGPDGPPNSVYGWGIINALAAVQNSVPGRVLTVASSNPSAGVSIAVSPSDANGQGGGTTQFTRTYTSNAAVTLSAPATAGGNNFQKWQRDGSDLTTNADVQVSMDANHTLTAVYATAASNAGLSLAFDGMIRDRVGQNELALSPDGQPDGVFTVSLAAGSGNRTVTRMQLNRAGPVGGWDTQAGDGLWTLGAANGLDSALLNASNDSVNFAVSAGSSFTIFAADYMGQMFISGSSFTLTVNFSDGSAASASTTVNSSPNNPTVGLGFNGMLRDRVGQGEFALSPDGHLDGVFTVTLNAGSGNRTVTGMQLNRLGPIGVWDTQGGDGFWSLGAANGLDTTLLNAGNDSVNFTVPDGGSFEIFAADYQGQMFVPGSAFTLNVNFADGSAATASASISSMPAVPTISLGFDGMVRDRVGQAEFALSPDGQLDGVFTVTLNPGSGSRTVSRLQLNRAGPVGIWDTQGGDGFWSLGAASGLDTALLNGADDGVNFALTEGSSFKIFAADYLGQMFVSGSGFTVTANFSDGSIAAANVTIP